MDAPGRRRLRPAALPPAALSLVLVTAGQLEVWTRSPLGGIGTTTSAPRWLLSLLVAVVTLSLSARRTHPAAVAGVVCWVLALQVLFVTPGVSLLAGLLPLLIALYSAAAAATRPWPVVALFTSLSLQAVWVARIPEERLPGEIVFGLFVLTGTWLAGHLERGRRQRLYDVSGELALLEQDRDAQMAAALADERASIARELHDVIAHSVSVMGVQAAGAQVLIDGDPAAAKASLRQIENQAREAVGELQRLLGVLRDVDGLQSREPQPGLAQVPALVEQMQRAGLPVELCVQGTCQPLPAGVDLAAYRVTQEALTNVLKHAGVVPVRVGVRYDALGVAIEVFNEGAPVDAAVRPGHGLIGMRERTALYGGTLDVEPAPTGGFHVAARFPVQWAAT